MLKTLAKEIKICSLTKDKSCSLPIIFSIDVTPKSLIPHGIISLKNLKSVFTFNAKPCIVTHFVILTPWAPIFSSLTETPVKPSFLVALILNNYEVEIYKPINISLDLIGTTCIPLMMFSLGHKLSETKIVNLNLNKIKNKYIAKDTIELVKNYLDKNEQVLFFVNRRGFAPYLICKKCGNKLVCSNCSLYLTFHKIKNKAVCHHCCLLYTSPSPRD